MRTPARIRAPLSCPAIFTAPRSRRLRRAFVLSQLIGLATLAVRAHDEFTERGVKFSAPGADIAGSLVLPPHAKKVPCVVIVGGTLSQTRDGGMTGRNIPPRDALKRLAEALAAGGYASLRYDRPGFGESRSKAGWGGSYHEEGGLAAAAIRFAREQKEISRVLAAGESAGAYMLCLAAKDGTQADGYVFLGGLCGPAAEMYEYNFGRLARYADRSTEHLDWVTKHARRDLALGRRYVAMLEAAKEGRAEFEIVDGDFRMTQKLARRQEELKFPPDEMFRHIRTPTLALGGAKDLNVPTTHPARIVQILHAVGNTNAASFLIPGADHSFQWAADDADVAWRERYTFESFKRPYATAVDQIILAWLARVAPSPLAATNHMLTSSWRQRAVASPERDPRTGTTPERIQLAPGIEIVEDITDRTKTAGVETLEGRIGPLLLAEGSQAHFIEMPAGMYLEEHPHGSESIIYTVRGRWVLCSQGRRHLMKPGTLFRFDANISTGYEVPFDEEAFILIFKGRRTTKIEKEFIDYLQGMAGRLQREHQAGVPFLLKELPADHPARKFAQAVNPGWAAGEAKK